MSYKDILKSLVPVEIGGDFDKETEAIAAALERTDAVVNGLLDEIFPDTANLALEDWERVYGIVPEANEATTSRRNRVIGMIRARGGLSRQYFIGLAAALGFTITITEYEIFRAGISRAGDPVYDEEYAFRWLVTIFGLPEHLFRAGISRAGDPVSYYTPGAVLENLFDELKPAHTIVVFENV